MRNDFHGEIFFLPKALGLALKHANCMVQSFHVTQQHFILRVAVGRDALPVSLDPLSKVFERFEALAFKSGLPVLNKSPCPTFTLIVPELAKRLLEQD